MYYMFLFWHLENEIVVVINLTDEMYTSEQHDVWILEHKPIWLPLYGLYNSHRRVIDIDTQDPSA